MTDSKIIKATLEVFKECRVQSFPIDCFCILEHYGYKVYSYEELKSKNKELYEMCIAYSADAFQERHSRIIAYNREMPRRRIRFSLMHELGHHILNHTGGCTRNEQEANAFSSNLLAPRMAIHYSHCKSAGDVAQNFDLSYEAASHAFDDYSKWYHFVSYYNMASLDKLMYAQFYHDNARQFVWHLERCPFCGRLLYNGKGCGCQTPACVDYYPAYDGGRWESEDDQRFQRALNHWLYGE